MKGGLVHQDQLDKKETRAEMVLMVCRVDLALLEIPGQLDKMDLRVYVDLPVFLG